MGISGPEVFLVAIGDMDKYETILGNYTIEGIYYTKKLAIQKYEQLKHKLHEESSNDKYCVVWAFYNIEDLDNVLDEASTDENKLYDILKLKKFSGMFNTRPVIIKSSLWPAERV